MRKLYYDKDRQNLV